MGSGPSEGAGQWGSPTVPTSGSSGSRPESIYNLQTMVGV